MKCLDGSDAGDRAHLQDNDVRRHSGRPGLLARRDPRPAQWRPARRQGGADRAPGKGRLQKRVRPATESGLPHRRLDGAERSGTEPAPAPRRRRPPSNHVAGASPPDANAHLKRRGRLQRPRLTFQSSKLSMETCDMMFDPRDLSWVDFEVASRLDLKAAGALRYATDVSTRAIILAYAIGDGPELAGMPTARFWIGATRQTICAPPTIVARHSPPGTQVSTATSGITRRSTFPSSRQSASST